MKRAFIAALMLTAGIAASVPRLHAQAQPNNQPVQPAGSGGSSQPTNAQPPPAQTQQQNNQNAFPEDTSSVPLMPSRDNPNPPAGAPDIAKEKIYLPDADFDPVRSPEDAGEAAESGESSSSSSLAGMGDLLPGADDETQPGKRNKKGALIEPEHRETAAEDENVGNYYLDKKNWKAALSRFQSAMVLDPDNPDVYWGLAECDRHLGNFADARTSYQKVVGYDPDSRHGKDARKALKDPEIANAKSSAQPAAALPQ